MITIHHLGVSQSDRIVWLMEELGLPYKLKWYNRKADRLAPDEFLALHPAATAPVIEDGGKILPESGAIVEHICHRHAGGRLTVRPDQPNYADYLYWMHWHNNVLGLFFAKAALRAQQPHGPEARRIDGLVQRRERGYYAFLEQTLAKSPYPAGSEFTCADIMVMFDLSSLPLFGGRSIDDLPNTVAYVKRIAARPAYIKAMQIAGPKAPPPKA
jgi:glutathione S-transferase